MIFRDREEGGRLLAEKLRGRHLVNPLVLAIPRGGVVTGAVLARVLNAELDVVLSRKLRDPYQPELAIGAITEDGKIYLTEYGKIAQGVNQAYLAGERQFQMDQIRIRRELVRKVRPPATIAGRSVIVTDDGIATGSTMIAALQTVIGQEPRELIVATPVAPPDRIEEIGRYCDEVICLSTPPLFWAIGQFYEEFRQVTDETVVELLSELLAPEAKAAS